MREWITNRRRARARLPKLAAWLREISEHVNGAKFDLNTYAEWPGAGRGTGPPSSVQEAKRCGFEGCAPGWAALNPAFRRAGLRIYEDGFGSEWGLATVDAAEFFGIHEEAAGCIFGPADADWDNHGEVLAEPARAHDPIFAAERVERFCRDNGISLP